MLPAHSLARAGTSPACRGTAGPSGKCLTRKRKNTGFGHSIHDSVDPTVLLGTSLLSSACVPSVPTRSATTFSGIPAAVSSGLASGGDALEVETRVADSFPLRFFACWKRREGKRVGVDFSDAWCSRRVNVTACVGHESVTVLGGSACVRCRCRFDRRRTSAGSFPD